MIETKKKLNLKKSSKTTIKIKKIPEIEEISKIRKTSFRYLFIFFIFAIAIITTYLIIHEDETHELTKERVKKFEKAIRRIVFRRHNKENCEQYALVAVRSAWFPLLKWGEVVASDSILLNEGEIWKYGKTCLGELGRYPGQIYYSDDKWLLDRRKIRYERQFIGSEKECLIEERKNIYNYPLLPECIKRKRKLIRPPGSKNDN